MSTDFGKEVARHRQSSRFGECGSPKPTCHSTNLHHIWHDEITCLHLERLGHVVWSPPVFAQLNRRLCRAADVSMAYIVICNTGSSIQARSSSSRAWIRRIASGT